MSAVSVESVRRTMDALLTREARPILYRDRATGEDLPLSPSAAASPTGLLPALVVAGEAVWREATGKGFALDIVPDKAALLGYRLRGIGAGSFSAVMLAAMEAAAQAERGGAIVVNDLSAVWAAAQTAPHQHREAHNVARPQMGASP